MVDGDYGDNVIGKPVAPKKKFEGLFLFVVGALIGIVLCGAVITLIPSLNATNFPDSATMAKMIYSGSECALRNNDTIIWIPSMVTQSDLDGNINGIPVCLPIDRKTGQRLKNN